MRSRNNRIDDIEALRAFAVLFTIFGHIKYLFPWGNKHLQTLDAYFGFWTGVDLFFAISGFVIARDLLGRLDASKTTESYWRVCFAFWIRRAFRIWPTAWFWSLFIIILSIAFNKRHEFGTLSQQLADFTSIIMHVANFHFWHCQAYGLTSECGMAAPWWSLSLEEQFYILLPFSVFIFRNKLPIVLLVIIALQIFIPRPVWSFMWVIRTDAICFGVALAMFSRSNLYSIIEPKFMSKAKVSIPVLALLIFMLASMPSTWDGKLNPVPFSTGMIAIISLILVFIGSYGKGYIVKNRAIKSVLLWIGSRSFALYLIHGITIGLTIVIWKHIEPENVKFDSSYTLKFFATWLVMTLVLAECNFRFIETPLRNMGKRFAKEMEKEGGSLGG